jgi:hypothetical protein
MWPPHPPWQHSACLVPGLGAAVGRGGGRERRRALLWGGTTRARAHTRGAINKSSSQLAYATVLLVQGGPPAAAARPGAAPPPLLGPKPPLQLHTYTHNGHTLSHVTLMHTHTLSCRRLAGPEGCTQLLLLRHPGGTCHTWLTWGGVVLGGGWCSATPPDPQSVAALDPLGGMAHMLHHMRLTHSSHGAPTY